MQSLSFIPMHRAKERGGNPRLAALLSYLGASADTVEASIGRDEATMAHATKIIEEWMTYLPEDCVKAMVNGGWHWSV